MRLEEFMTRPVHTVGVEMSATDAWEIMRRHRIRHLVVLRNKEIAGVLSATDLGGSGGEAVRHGRLVTELMTRKVVTATPETTVREAANLMRGHSIGCLPVHDGAQLQGMVTTFDLLELLGRGIERPVAATERQTLKDRGSRPRALTVAKRSARAKRTPART
jgi:acetoin utilization protein AcuB